MFINTITVSKFSLPGEAAQQRGDRRVVPEHVRHLIAASLVYYWSMVVMMFVLVFYCVYFVASLLEGDPGKGGTAEGDAADT